MDDLTGQLIKGYELREQIGVGGYGAVYRAIQPSVSRDVAIKVILPRYANHPDFIRRFEAEAQLVARLEHPHIVPLYDYWREPDSAYLVMRWLRGGSLHDRLAGTPWPPEQVVTLLDQLGAALTIAHRHGVVHRDLKPDNILLDEDDNAYLADLGIAKDLGDASDPAHADASITKTGMMMGSPAYISPEQIKAEPITPQTDIYSLGIMLYEILTGELPFAGQTPVIVLFRHVHEQLPPLRLQQRELGDALNAVLQRATAKHPQERYPDVMGLVADFRRAIGSAAPMVRSAGAPPAAAPSISGNGHRMIGARRTGSIYDTGVLYQTALIEAVVPAVENPYKGLRAFQEADASDFFGREALTQRLLARLGESTPLARFLAVVGPSGGGKSSVVRAGVVPALRRGVLPGSRHWYVLEMIPGAQPMAELATALLRVAVGQPPDLLGQLQRDERGLLHVVQELLPGGTETELVLVIDQFEEVFTLVEDEATRIHFLNSLLAAVTGPHARLRVILTLRADFYDRPLLYSGLSELVRQRTEVVTPLAAEELQRAIVGPAERAGVSLEMDLIGAIIHDVGEQPGTLPLMQYALTELFERRVGRVMVLDAYQSSGGVMGALARRADETYNGLNEQEREAARQLFLRLVTLGEGTEDTRRRVLRSELAAVVHEQRTIDHGQRTIDRVIDTYGKYRLLTFDRDPMTRGATVEVAHEALIRTWGRLRDWLDQSRDDLRLQRRLAAAAIEWNNAGRDPSYLATGVRLEQFADWATDTQLALNVDERAYLDASLAERDARNAQDVSRREREAALEQRSRRVLRALVGVFVVATVLALGLAALAFTQRQAAQQQRAIAEQQKVVADQSAAWVRFLALSSAAQAALSQGNADAALMLATIANSLPEHTRDAERLLSEAAYAPGTRYRQIEAGGVQGLDFSPDGRTFLVGSTDKTIVLRDSATGQQIRTFEGHTSQVQSVAFSPDSTRAISGSQDKTVILWDVATGKLIRRFPQVHTADVKQVVFSPNGRTAVSAGGDALVILWDVETGQEIRRFSGHTQQVRGVAFSPDGKLLLTGGGEADLMLWDVASGQRLRVFDHQHSQEIDSVAFSPDGRTALSGSKDTTMILWDVATGKLLQRFRGHTREVWVTRFSPDGRLAISGGLDNRIGLWNLSTGQNIRFLTGHGAAVRAVAISPDGRRVLSGSEDFTVRLWDLDNGAQVRRFDGHTDEVTAVAFSPDGKQLLSGSEDTATHLWDIAGGRDVRPPALLHEDGVRAVAFSPDGKTALSGSGDSKIILQDVATGSFIRRFDGHTGSVNSVVFSPDGKTALSGASAGDTVSDPEYIILWDVATGRKIRTFKGHSDSVSAVAFGPDGKTALSASTDTTLILWDVATGTPIRTLKGHKAKIRALAISPDGKTAVSGDEQRTIILWDLATGARIRTFEGQHNGGIFALAFSPDGQTFASGSEDTTVLLWDISAGVPIRRFAGHDAVVHGLAFSPDGRQLASASADRSVRLWRIDTSAELLAWARANRYIPSLPCDQQQTYQLDVPCAEPGAPDTGGR
jgi:WD40 repeat protein